MYKEQAYMDYMNMIRKSWTWLRLTADERARFVEVTFPGPMSRDAKH